MFGGKGEQGQIDCLAHLYQQVVAGLRPLTGMGFVVELDGANNRQVACSAHDKIKVLGSDAIERALASSIAQAGLYSGYVSYTDLTEDPVLRAYSLVKNAEK